MRTNAGHSVGVTSAVRVPQVWSTADHNVVEHEPWRQLQHLLESRELDAVVLNSYQAVTYFAGTHLLSQLLLPDRLAYLMVNREGPTLVVCDIEAAQAREQSGLERVLEYTEFEQSPEEVLAHELVDRGLSSAAIGVEARRMPAWSRDDLAARLPRLRFAAIDHSLEALQAVKSDPALQNLAKAAQTTQVAIEIGISAATASSTERDINSTIVASLSRAGGIPVFCFFGAGPRALLAHPEGHDASLDPGTVWRTDVGARFDGGVMSDVARCGVVGQPEPRQDDAFAVVRAAQQAGLDALRPGARASDVYGAVRDTIVGAGYDFQTPHVGHGLGVGVHEQPIFAPSNRMVLVAGMVVNIEPILLLRQHGEAYHTEDLAVVTDGGHRLLTSPQTELMRIGV